MPLACHLLHRKCFKKWEFYWGVIVSVQILIPKKNHSSENVCYTSVEFLTNSKKKSLWGPTSQCYLAGGRYWHTNLHDKFGNSLWLNQDLLISCCCAENFQCFISFNPHNAEKYTLLSLLSWKANWDQESWVIFSIHNISKRRGIGIQFFFLPSSFITSQCLMFPMVHVLFTLVNFPHFGEYCKMTGYL